MELGFFDGYLNKILLLSLITLLLPPQWAFIYLSAETCYFLID